MNYKPMQIKRFILAATLLLLLAACRQDEAPATGPDTTLTEVAVGETAVPAAAGTATEIVSPTPLLPTPTPEPPLAARVNGQPILLAEYEQELARHEQAQAELGLNNGDEDYRELVLQALIERELIAQAAATQGVVITPEMVTAKIEELRAMAGESGNFEAWLEANQWTEEEFREALAQEMVTEAMVTAVTADVPQAVEQVRARYIQVNDAELAQSLLVEIEAGANFATLASLHSLDQVTAQNGGDLDFFARGSLLVPAVEEAAFALEPGETSELIAATNSDGQPVYYLVQVIERDPQRPLTANMRYNLLQQQFERWLAGLWAEANIERFVNTGNSE
jgi:parvulin-like peptidyl-prolyl isomerase